MVSGGRILEVQTSSLLYAMCYVSLYSSGGIARRNREEFLIVFPHDWLGLAKTGA